MDDRLLRRLVGAAMVFAVVFVLTLLLPAPGEVEQKEAAESRVTIDLRPAGLAASKTPAAEETFAVAQRPPEAEAEAPAPPAPRPEPPKAAPAEPPIVAARPPAATPEKKPSAPAVDTRPEPVAAAPKPQPKPEPKPATVAQTPARAAPPPTAGDGRWWVQVVAVSDWDRAHALMTRIEAAGYSGTIQSREAGDKPLFRVRVGAYPTRDAAVKAQSALATDGYGATVVLSDE